MRRNKASLNSTDGAPGAQICFWKRLALLLTFSPWEKEQTSEAQRGMEDRPATSTAGSGNERTTFLPLPRQRERAG
jgi:hypothetical protein